LWWCDIHALCSEEWLRDHVSRSVGDKKNTLFWTDVWLGGVSLSVRFSRLFDLTVFKEESVFDMCQLGWVAWRVVGRGVGDRGCLLGRRSWWGNSCYCFIMLLCRLIRMVNVFGLWKLLNHFRFVVSTII